MKILTEQEAQEAKERLEQELLKDPTKKEYQFLSGKINWVEEKGNWTTAKMHSKSIMMEDWDNKEVGLRDVFIAYPTDLIIGKPQLIYQTKQKIILIRGRASEKRNGDILKIVKFFDEPYDKRYDGIMTMEAGLEFWVYRIVDHNKEYYVLSQEELPLQSCEVRGMSVEMGDHTEVKKTMRLKALSNIFFVKEYKPLVKVVSKEDLVLMTKNISFESWSNYLNIHPLGTINKFPEMTNIIRTAQLLSGKIDGWPMHLAVIGPPGTRKSNGWLETTNYKFSQDEPIREGAASTLKSLGPSFKEKPANIGCLARAERIGVIDELGKMVESESNKHQSAITNVLGEINFLLDHKKRLVGSGNDNDVMIQATAKFLFASNAVKGRDYLKDHVGLIDPTTMSRIIWWVQDKEEQDYVMGPEGIQRLPPTHTQEYQEEGIPPTPTQVLRGERDEREIKIGLVLGETEYLSNNDFLTLFDTCNSFICSMDDNLVSSIVQNSNNRSKEPLRSIWRPRSEHHVRLIIDGLCKIRCLFKDHKNDFTANADDYALASKLIEKIITSWDCKLTINDMTRGAL